MLFEFLPIEQAETKSTYMGAVSQIPIQRIIGTKVSPTTVEQLKDKENKTQYQLCKRQAGPIIPFCWSCLILKRVSLWIWSLGGSQQPFSYVSGNFRHGDDKQTTRWSKRKPAIDQWEGSLLQHHLYTWNFLLFCVHLFHHIVQIWFILRLRI